MILRNTIRPQHNRKPGRRKTRLTRRNSHLPRITPNTKISIIIADNLTNPTLTSTRQTQIQIPRPPLNSSTRKRSTQSNPQISRRRRGHRRLQPHTPRTDVLPHRSNRITRRIHQTQRNNRLRPHHNPPPRRKQPRHQQHNQPHPPHRNQAPQKPTHLQPPAESPTAPASTAHKPPDQDIRITAHPQCYPPPRLIKPSLDNRGASGGADTDAILTHIRANPDPPTREERMGKKYRNTLLNRATAAPMRPPGKDSGFANCRNPISSLRRQTRPGPAPLGDSPEIRCLYTPPVSLRLPVAGGFIRRRCAPPQPGAAVPRWVVPRDKGFVYADQTAETRRLQAQPNRRGAKLNGSFVIIPVIMCFVINSK